MSITDKVERMRAELDGLVREQRDRQALQERQGAEIKAKADEYMTKQVQAAERYVEHRRELGRREKEAGGWATEKTLSEKSTVMALGPDDDEQVRKPAGYEQFETSTPPRPEVPAAAPATWQEPPSSPPPVPAPAAAEAEAPPARRRGRHARSESGFDDDDFSNNSWMVD
jgi:hypothetical protein